MIETLAMVTFIIFMLACTGLMVLLGWDIWRNQ